VIFSSTLHLYTYLHAFFRSYDSQRSSQLSWVGRSFSKDSENHFDRREEGSRGLHGQYSVAMRFPRVAGEKEEARELK